MGQASPIRRELHVSSAQAAPVLQASRSEPERLSDDELVTLARAQVPGIEGHLYDRLAPLVNRLVFSTLGTDSEHDDIVHDVLIRIFRKVSTVRDPALLEQWTSRVTLNAVRNEIRRRALRRWVFWNAFEDPGPLTYLPDLDGRELVERTQRVLARLPADERIALSLRLFETDTVEEIAALTACSASTVKRRLRRAQERFVRLARQDPLVRPWVEAIAEAEGDHDE